MCDLQKSTERNRRKSKKLRLIFFHHLKTIFSPLSNAVKMSGLGLKRSYTHTHKQTYPATGAKSHQEQSLTDCDKVLLETK